MAASVDLDYADRVTGVPFIGQPIVNTDIMSILCNATKFNVHCRIFDSGSGQFCGWRWWFPAAKNQIFAPSVQRLVFRRFKSAQRLNLWARIWTQKASGSAVI
jgi:hypothetical protein